MAQTGGPRRATLLASAARSGQAAWLLGNLYEAAVGMPELLSLARPGRTSGVLQVGSPVRYFAPIAPLALGASTLELLTAWRSPQQRRLVLLSAAGLATAIGISGYLIRTVNIPLLAGGPPGPGEQERLVTTWHRWNTVRVVALTVAMGTDRLRRHRDVVAAGRE